jgi:hypothetical protein
VASAYSSSSNTGGITLTASGTSSLSTGAVVGIVMGVLGLLGLVVGLSVWLCCRCRRKQKYPPAGMVASTGRWEPSQPGFTAELQASKVEESKQQQQEGQDRPRIIIDVEASYH